MASIGHLKRKRIGVSKVVRKVCKRGFVTVMVGEPKAGMSNCIGPWANGFFEKNTKAFIVDLLPEEPSDFDMPDLQLDSNEDVKDQPKVLATVFRYCLFTD